MSDDTAYIDHDASVECFVLADGTVFVTVPSIVSLTPDQAQRFASALAKCATEARLTSSSAPSK